MGKKTGRPKGRPPKPLGEVRITFPSMKMTFDERAAATRAAALAGARVTVWAREQVLRAAGRLLGAPGWGDRRRALAVRIAAAANPESSLLEQETLLDAWLRLPVPERVTLLEDLPATASGWLTGVARGADPDEEPRAISAAAQATGLEIRTVAREVVWLAWRDLPILADAYPPARAWIELRFDGRILEWPATGDRLRIADALALGVVTALPRTVTE